MYSPKEDSFFLSEILKEYLKNRRTENLKALDIGCGTGIQAESLSRFIEKKNILCVDTKKIVFSQTPYFSSRARKTIFRVIKNPTRPGIYSRVLDIDRKAVEHVKLMGFNSVKSNLFEKIKGKFDIIAFNAQYLPSDQHDKEKDTTGGKRGDEIILRFLKQVRKHLENKGKIFLLLSSLTPRKRIEKELETQRLSIANIFKKRIFFEKLEVWVIGES